MLTQTALKWNYLSFNMNLSLLIIIIKQVFTKSTEVLTSIFEMTLYNGKKKRTHNQNERVTQTLMVLKKYQL